MHAARVLGDIATDGACDLAAGVGRVIQAVRRSGFTDREIAHTGLHRGRAGHGVDTHDPVEAGQRERHAQRMGHRPARQAGAGTPGHDRYVHGVAGLQHRRDLRIGLGQYHDQRPGTVGGEPVTLIGDGVFPAVQDAGGRQHLVQGLHDLGTALAQACVVAGNQVDHAHHCGPRCRAPAAARTG